jgi:hypothetical protein
MFSSTQARAASAAALLGLVGAAAANAGAIRTPAGFDSNAFTNNDDDSQFISDVGFTLNFFGVTSNSLYINNNGNITFDAPMSAFMPEPIAGTGQPMLAPFFADVDTRGGNPLTWGNATVGGRDAFFVNWIGVGHFDNEHDRLNSFQLVLIDRSDTGAGNFDFEFNYDQILWEAGTASFSDDDGLGGQSARVGFSNGLSGEDQVAFELMGSAENGALVDGGAHALISNRLNSDLDGRYRWSVRGGQTNPVIPLPGAAGLAIAGIGAVAARRRR